ncbi:MAG: DNA topoisomerase 3 [Proteobacteria bacterium]|nr:DNA topoisomerase 3 [Pseudomonadota bacterium]
MKVIIAEKPSVARDIAAVLDITGKKKGYIEGRGCAITWAFGHLVTLQEPGEYDPALKRWSLDTLPFVPDKFKLTLIKNRGVDEQFHIIEALCQQAEEIICATDAGREGELIFRYILAQANCEDKPIRRLWLNSLTPEAIQEAFKDLKDGHDYDALYAAARCRSESDWIVGLNSTRYYTVKHGRIGGGNDRVLWSIGRVQTPVLAMIVERDDTILQFRPQLFWELTSRYREVVFKYTGQRFEKPEKAQVLLDKISGQPFNITGINGKEKKEQPPQLFDLTTLQREVNKMHGLSAADTLAATQNLYEKKLVTYPRTDSRYLSQDMKPRIPKILAQLKAIRPDDIAPLNLDKLPFSKRIIDDSKVTDHHAIIPTGVKPQHIGAHEQLVYEAITTQFIAAFYPVCVKNITTVDGVSNEVTFQAKGTQVMEPGWTALFLKKIQSQEAADDQALPAFEQGETGPHAPSLHEGKTKPPNHFTENSLLGAMEAAGKFVEDDALREALKERGIGTPATRAAIIETLLNRNYIRREKKQLRCTDMGRILIALIQDPLLKSPEMTGEWEEKLKQIERKQLDPDVFMTGIGDYIRGLIQTSSASSADRVDTDHWASCPLCGKEVVKGNRAYGCSGWNEGCPFVLEPECKGITLNPRQVQTLLQQRILPQPIRIDDELRMLILSTQGMPIDLRLPSADRQKKEKKTDSPAPKS